MERNKINCLWNDVICLQDEQAATYVCKALFQLEGLKTGTCLESLEAVDIAVSKKENMIAGEAVFLATLGREESVSEKLELFLPFIKEEIGEAEIVRQQVEYYQLHYLQGCLLKDKLWVEAVVSGVVAKNILPVELALGEMALSERLELPEKMPSCSQVISTQVYSAIEEINIKEETAIVNGKHTISILYEKAAAEGEKLYVYRRKIPFQGEMAVHSALENWQDVRIYYRLITAQQLSEREISVTATGVIIECGQESREDEVEEFIKEAKVGNEIKGVQRISSRDSLAKYMRELESLVNEEKTLRNFDLQDK